MSVTMIPFEEGEKHLDWMKLCAAFEAGHKLPKAEIGDTFLYRDPDTLLSRSAWIDGLGLAVKSATIFPGNPKAGKPMINGSVCVFGDGDGHLEAVVDFHLVTKWKTAGDSLFAATKLARPDSEKILIVGAGTVGRSLFQAYSAAFPKARFTVWNRTRKNAEAMAEECPGLQVADDLEAAVGAADIVTSATMSTEPVLKGERAVTAGMGRMQEHLARCTGRCEDLARQALPAGAGESQIARAQAQLEACVAKCAAERLL